MTFTTGAWGWAITTTRLQEVVQRRQVGDSEMFSKGWPSEAFPRPWGWVCASALSQSTQGGRLVAGLLAASPFNTMLWFQRGVPSGHSLALPALLQFSWTAAYGQGRGKLGDCLTEASSSGITLCVPGFLLKIIKISKYPQSKTFYRYWRPFLMTAWGDEVVEQGQH